jgi:DNA primase large subunit
MQNQENLGANVTRIWMAEKRIVIHSVLGYTQESTDIFFDSMLETALAWDKSQPYLALIDLRKAALTNYSRNKAQAFFKAFPRDLKGTVVSLLPNNVVGQMMSLMAKRVPVRQLRGVEQHFLHDYAAGLAILEKRLPLTKSPDEQG